MVCIQTFFLLVLILKTATSCSYAPFSGIFIDQLQSTSNELLLVGEFIELKKDVVKERKIATIHLDDGNVTEGSPPPDVQVYPPGLGEPLNSTVYEITFIQDFTGEFVAIINNKETNETISFALPDVSTSEYGNTGEMKPEVIWFVSSKIQRTYALYHNATDNSSSRPQTVAVIAPAPGLDGNVVYLTDHNVDDACLSSFCDVCASGFCGSVIVYDTIQLAALPSTFSCDSSVLVFYNETVLKESDIETELLPPRGITAAPEEAGLVVYQADYPTDGQEGIAIAKFSVETGDSDLIVLNIDGIFESSGASCAPLNPVSLFFIPVILLSILR